MKVDSKQVEVQDYPASGIHIMADCQGIDRNLLNDGERLKSILVAGINLTCTTILDLRMHQFQPSGVTIFVLLAESHASIHTYPALGVAMLDMFTCGNINSQLGMHNILDNLKPTQSNIKIVERNVVNQNAQGSTPVQINN